MKSYKDLKFVLEVDGVRKETTELDKLVLAAVAGGTVYRPKFTYFCEELAVQVGNLTSALSTNYGLIVYIQMHCWFEDKDAALLGVDSFPTTSTEDEYPWIHLYRVLELAETYETLNLSLTSLKRRLLTLTGETL